MLPAVIGLPVAAGLAASALGAFGLMPGLSGGHVSLDTWRLLATLPGIWTSLALTLRTGVLATVLALTSALLIGLGGRPWMWRGLAPLLAIPHAAMAVGLAFLVAPTGFLVRLAGLGPLGFATVGDRFGAVIILALWLKETPFLLLAVLSALGQADLTRAQGAAASLGYAPARVALLVVLPRVWPQIRLPLLAVLAFSLSATDVALLLGPQTPPTLAVRILRWAGDPDFARWQLAAAAALVLLGLVATSFAGLCGIEAMARRLARFVSARGRRGAITPAGPAGVLCVALGVFALGSVAMVLAWAGASAWRFPDTMPQDWSWGLLAGRLDGVADAAATSLWLGMVSTAAALVLAVAVLQARAATWWVWWPLLLPQAGFLFGMQMLLVAARLDGSELALIWAHLLFVLPYVVLALAGPWRALDPRYRRAAAGLQASPWRVLVRVTLPLLSRPLRNAAAIGFAVSLALYLPTLFAGAGRTTTLATLAVSLASGADRRLLAAAALAQAALPALAFAVAVRRS